MFWINFLPIFGRKLKGDEIHQDGKLWVLCTEVRCV